MGPHINVIHTSGNRRLPGSDVMRWLTPADRVETPAADGDKKEQSAGKLRNPEDAYFKEEAVVSGNSSFQMKQMQKGGEGGYTLGNAVLAQFNKGRKRFFTLEELSTGNYDKSNLYTDFLTKEEYDLTLQKLRAQGSSPQIDWKSVEIDLKGMDSWGSDTEKLEVRTDYLASRYAALKFHIENNFTGKDRTEQMQALENSFRPALESLAGSYADMTGGQLEKLGVSGERDRIYDSILTNFQKSAGAYSEYLKGRPDFLGLKGTEDEWLLNDDAYIAAALRERVSLGGSAPASADDAGYSMEELMTIGSFARELNQIAEEGLRAFENPVSNSEEALGMDIAMAAIKTDVVLSQSQMGDRAKSVIGQALEGAMNLHMDRVDEELSEARALGYAGNPRQYEKLDREAVMDVYQKMIEAYSQSGKNVRVALAVGGRFARGRYLEKTESGEYSQIFRYGSGKDRFWECFDTPYPVHSPYDNDASTLDRYMTNWKEFIETVQSGRFNSENQTLTMDKSWILENISNV